LFPAAANAPAGVRRFLACNYYLSTLGADYFNAQSDVSKNILYGVFLQGLMHLYI
jgi:hypothetical protein